MDGAKPDPGAFLLATVAWVVALVATLGSLFFGEVMKLPPCTLCWYQRICLFPLVPVLAVGIVLRDRRLATYGLPLPIIGLGLAVYHNLVYYRVIDEDLTPCTQGVSCASRQIEWLGFVTIPLMSMTAFVLILACLVAHERRARRVRP